MKLNVCISIRGMQHTKSDQITIGSSKFLDNGLKPQKIEKYWLYNWYSVRATGLNLGLGTK